MPEDNELPINQYCNMNELFKFGNKLLGKSRVFGRMVANDFDHPGPENTRMSYHD